MFSSPVKIGIIGLGVVGKAIYQVFQERNLDVIGYDKYIPAYMFNLTELLDRHFIFICVPTPFSSELGKYSLDALEENCQYLHEKDFKGLVVNKCTVEPETTQTLSDKYQLHMVHNPEFLNARTAKEDFANQHHIVLGKTLRTSSMENDRINRQTYLQKYIELIDFYENQFPDAEISECYSDESEMMKIGVNSFYAVKVQFFNELYDLSQKLGAIRYDTVRNLMLKNNWINPMHTQVPGTDGKLSYGGMCLPKDSQALLEYMKSQGALHGVLEATVKERNSMREEH